MYDVPLNAELNAEGARGKLVKGGGNNPEGDECSDEENEDAGKRGSSQVACNWFGYKGTHIIVRRRPMYWLADPAMAPPLHRAKGLRSTFSRLKRETHVIAPQLPMIVATVALNFVNPLLSCR